MASRIGQDQIVGGYVVPVSGAGTGPFPCCMTDGQPILERKAKLDHREDGEEQERKHDGRLDQGRAPFTSAADRGRGMSGR